ncbi:MAG TPA: PilZ domain-containing protein [Candidatus Dormibacteraeota bacterium]|nr:PilZ domain-containing protein [Candidatus Dormibacteraeota bacterium]
MNDGTAYLRALKQSTDQPSAAAAAPAREADPHPYGAVSPTEPATGEPFQGVEKRRSLRYKCEGSAEVREEGCDVRTWATFTDVSVHGCYVEAQATYPAGTVLQMKLESAGLRVDCKGKVRVSYPYLGMGIAFTEVSEENMARLRQLLATISRPCVIMGPGIASTLPAAGPLDAVPAITDPAKAIEAIMEFFQSRQMLMRDDFLRIIRKSQK